MSKKEEFKAFAALHPELVNHIKNNTSSWQDFYEIYDIYGESPEAWKPYLNVKTNDEPILETPKENLNDLTNIFKKADMNSIQKHIGTAQKAIGLFQEFVGKNTAAGAAGTALGAMAAKPTSSRPINKFFED